jgi:excisionase family DNA binding protein
VIPLSSTTEGRFVTVAEVADRLRVSTMTVYRLIQSGELPAGRIGKSYRLREADVDAFLAHRFTASA